LIRTTLPPPATPRLAIVSAMEEEMRGLLAHLVGAHKVETAGRTFWLGRLGEQEVVLVLSRIGKVAASTTVCVLLLQFGVDRIVFTGVAGGLGASRVGDIVISTGLVQHDMDASPLFPRFEIPLLGVSRLESDQALAMQAQAAAQSVLADAMATDPSAPALNFNRQDLSEFGINDPQVRCGLVLSGDQFVSSAAQSQQLFAWFPDALAVEMEGAAVAQVCHDFQVPFVVIRTISDRADDAAHVDFKRFISRIASRYSVAIALAMTARSDPVNSSPPAAQGK
jgi:adenosylhomocysteine nucleosidase